MNRHLKISLLWLGLLANIAMAVAQTPADTLRLSLDDALVMGLQNNLNLKNANLDYLKAKKKVWEVTAIGLPQANVAGSYQYSPSVPELSLGKVFMPGNLPDGVPITKDDILAAYQDAPAIPFGSKNAASVDFTVSQLIFNGEWLVGLQAASAYERLQKKLTQKSEYNTRESITSAYNAVLIIQEAYNNLNTSLEALTKTYEQVKAYNEQGLNESTDVDQLKITVNNLKSGVENLKGQIVTVNYLLKIQLGLELEQPIALTNSLDDLVKLAPLQTMVADTFNVAMSVDYQLAESQERINKLLINREYMKFLPTVSGFYVHHERITNNGLDFQSPDILGLKVSLPILTGTSRLATLSQAKIEYARSQNSKKLAEQGLITEFTAVRNNYISQYNAFLNWKESMELSLNVYNKNLIKYQNGMLSSIDLTNSQNQYLNAQKSYFEAELNLLNAKAKLERILTQSL